MNLIRTEKQFTKENLPIGFLKEAIAIACSESNVKKYNDDLFYAEISFKGVKNGCSVHPWNENHSKMGYTKTVDYVRLSINNGFDSFALLFNSGSIQGFFKNNPDKIVCQVNTVKWCNLLLEYEFLKLELGYTKFNENKYKILNRCKYIKVGEKEFKVRTTVGNTYFTYEKDENSHFDFSGDLVRNASTLRVEASIIEK